MSYLEFASGDISPCGFIYGQVFHHPARPPFSWYVQVTARVWAIACATCQGLILHTIICIHILYEFCIQIVYMIYTFCTSELMCIKCIQNGYIQNVSYISTNFCIHFAYILYIYKMYTQFLCGIFPILDRNIIIPYRMFLSVIWIVGTIKNG